MKKILLPFALALFCTQAHAQSITDGLLLRLNFAGNAKDGGPFLLNTTAATPTLTTDALGQSNQAYQFNGSSDKITVAQSNSIEVSYPFTMAAWVYMEDSSKAFPIFANDMNAAVYSGASMTVALGKFSASQGDGNGAGAQFRSTAEYQTLLRSKTWIHLACVFNSIGSMDLYVNGVKVTGTYSGTGSSMAYMHSGAAVGFNYSRSANPHQFAKGKIDNVMYYGRGLSDIEIKMIKDMILVHDMDNLSDAGPYNHVSNGSNLTNIKNRFGENGKATFFNGNSNKWTYPASSTYKINFPMTMGAWVKLDSISGNRIIMNLSDHVNNSYAGVQLLVQNGIPFINLGDNNGAGVQFRKSYQINDTLKTGTWYFIVAECPSFGSFKLYINGIEKTGGAVSGTATTMAHNASNGYLGYSSNPFGSPFYFAGGMDDVFLIHGTLGATAIAAMFKAGIYFDQQPLTISGNVGSVQVLNAHATGTGAVTYQWQKKNGSVFGNLNGKTSNVLTFQSLGYADTGYYRCISASSGVRDTSNVVHVGVAVTNNISDDLIEKIMVYPNPFTQNITLSGLENNTQIRIFDSKGCEVYSCTNNQNKITLTLPDGLTSGLYFVELRTQKTTCTLNIIKN